MPRVWRFGDIVRLKLASIKLEWDFYIIERLGVFGESNFDNLAPLQKSRSRECHAYIIVKLEKRR